jgi:hypothetical protein
MRQSIFPLLLAGTVLLSACETTPQPAQQSWQEHANECYAAVQRGEGRTFQGRTGLAACDRYVEQARQDEAAYNARLNAIAPLLMQPTQPMQQQNPRLNCTTQYYGNQAYTNCR